MYLCNDCGECFEEPQEEFGLDGPNYTYYCPQCGSDDFKEKQISHEEEVANRKFQLEIKRQNEKFREEHPEF